jgi:uncharacterized protein YbjT (DUF2867 family)
MIVVTGATGNVGRLLVQALTEAGEAVTAVSRHPQDDGARHRRADLAEPGTLKPVLDGADALFLLTAGGRPGEIVDVARAAGVRRVVLLSSLGAGTRPDRYPPFVMFEAAVRDSGLDWTILRPGGFASNTFLWAEQVRAERTVAAPFGDVGLPHIDPADIAAVAAVVLTGPDHQGEALTLSGPEPLTPGDQVAALARALRRPLRYEPLPDEEARAGMAAEGTPPDLIDAFFRFFSAGEFDDSAVTAAVHEITGRPPGTFGHWARAHAGLFG